MAWLIQQVACDAIHYKVSKILKAMTQQKNQKVRTVFQCGTCGTEYPETAASDLQMNDYLCERCRRGQVQIATIGQDGGSKGVTGEALKKYLQPLLDQIKEIEMYNAPINPYKAKNDEVMRLAIETKAERDRGGGGHGGGLYGRRGAIDGRALRAHDGREKIEVVFEAQENQIEADRLAAAANQQHGIPAWLDDEGEHHYDFDVQIDFDDEDALNARPVDEAVRKEVEEWYQKNPLVAVAKAQVAVVKEEGEESETVAVDGREKRVREVTQEDEAAMSDREYESYFKKCKRS